MTICRACGLLIAMSKIAQDLAARALDKIQDRLEVPRTYPRKVPVRSRKFDVRSVSVTCAGCSASGRALLGGGVVLPEGWATVILKSTTIPVCSEVCSRRVSRK